ncbi:Succinylglutamate desuccinylase / Aspartoacylase family protein [Methanobrevibacter gottschalkii]|uniref:Succinylglutamate desuccinylase/aspartoacylase family protein n=2 Tax=Methanobrevibacter gottschalkii TaxID=190974 RepID=A0A3N5C5E2_9EURY|nr:MULTISPECIES: succinylglutamate desuccinylase/aspartoacylase family protein [Methanobrevibacter]MCQ2970983.1 succinylglutamate desuccinylase/aspartoacylase family protein [archaeon]OEC96832.1 hypothetical protein A9505_06310 [Methanobrevibacter sp. A27]RPF51551.1 succinylglutamate desuccinylase/aspartoacylase family protein [Methanobrevibacter gottschalkii DSM 11977]SEK71908.1 Succinylglutamate desuccinylase / Aspartoacylase family protein [Methanobrevibacter gottschalkii]
MKKIYSMLLLIVMLCSLSIVSASENLSTSDNPVVVDNVDMSSKNIGSIPDVTSASNDVVVSENSSVEWKSYENEKDDNVSDNQSNSSSNSTSNGSYKEESVVSNVVTKNVSSSYGTVVNYNIKVLDQFKKPMVGKTVSVTIGKKTVEKITDSDGMVTFTLNCQAGKYVIKYKVDNINGSNSYIVKNKISLTVLNWNLKGDVSKINLIKKNMPNNTWVKKAVAATKKGIPLLKFKGGKGKIVFMTAGVHGNELSSQVAAMKMIKYLSDNPISGTVYIMPFVNVKAIAKKVRYTDKDYNRIASSSGTIPNKIVKLVVKYKCNSYGDFHTTKPGGAPGKDIVMGSKSLKSKSADLTNYIAKKCKVNKRIYSHIGQEYPGALFENVNKKGITSVICEVALPHNTVTTKTVKTSFNMMKYLLKYNSVI